ncbi:rho GTPase-activating protein 7-like isoform X2 [Macadamia integrifolia]|uniref:rho GTPase-activating protein 7-like isoform X2 n=1 Tax=Macadamia integrifolia TaxID=60698 RepID=UPI001C4F1755|nr:rho GTPase-activating protein 7-like isoform X2 [Macadamia integrifolia]
MVTRNADSSQGDGGLPSPPPPRPEADQLPYHSGNTVFKSGPLFISSKGIGWTSWKKRWFILTRSSLVFFRSDPSVVTQKSSEVNLTLGGIDLNNSGSVVVRADKKLLTVLFPDGRDGRTFTLKAETSEDLHEWKSALETALEQAPSAALVMGQNGIFRNEAADSVDGTLDQCRDKQQLRSIVIGRPILLALEDIDGTPSFLEKALSFLEQYGVKEEGILRQAADVDDVELRVREYEEGKSEFSPEEDAHVIADCVKHVLRELPSSPVPASCCNALLEAYRSDRGVRIKAMRAAIAETFPEPNCRLLQRILKMMQAVASHKAENRMSLPAVAACMAPLLLRPLLAGDCELGNDFKMGGDGSVQLLQAAAAANHAQAIVITLLEEYRNIFQDDQLQDGPYSPESYSASEGSCSEDDEASDDDECNYSQHDLDADTEDDPEHVSSGTCSESSGNGGNNLDDYEVSEGSDSAYESYAVSEDSDANQESPSEHQSSVRQDAGLQSNNNLKVEENISSAVYATESCESMGDVPASTVGDIPASTTSVHQKTGYNRSSSSSKSTNKQDGPVPCAKPRTVWGRTAAKKNLSTESIDSPGEDEAVILRLEVAKNDLQNRIAEEEKGNVILKASLQRRKKALHDRRLALERDVARLQEQLQREMDLREALEAGLGISPGHLPFLATIDCTLDQQCQKNHGSVKDSHNQKQQTPDRQAVLNDNQQKAIETAEPAHPHKRTKNTSLDGADSVNMRTQECQSSSSKQAPHKKLLDSIYDNLTKSKGVPATSSAVLPVVVEHTALSNSKKSGKKDENTKVALADYENFLAQEPPSLSNKQPPKKQHLGSNRQSNTRSDPPSLSTKQPSQKQQLDSTSHNSTKSAGISAASSAVEPIASSNSKTSGSKVEGTVSTSSALTKLTTRLNFLKERRNQIVNELQNLDKGRGSEGQSVSAPPRMNSR